MKYGFGIGLIACLFAPVLAQDAGKKQEPPDEKAMMEAWMKAAQPNENHKLLEKMAGSWTTVSKMEGPGEAGKESKGTCEGKTILGGRFIHFANKGEWGGQPLEGFGVLGYDNTKKKFTEVWTDSMSTALWSAEGDYDKATNAITLSGEYPDPMSGGKVTMSFRWVYTFKSDKEFTFEMWEAPAEMDKQHKAMMVTFTKK